MDIISIFNYFLVIFIFIYIYLNIIFYFIGFLKINNIIILDLYEWIKINFYYFILTLKIIFFENFLFLKQKNNINFINENYLNNFLKIIKKYNRFGYYINLLYFSFLKFWNEKNFFYKQGVKKNFYFNLFLIKKKRYTNWYWKNRY